jgi:ferric-dicitrate binding protein FerR (iron transport regulator)
VKTSDESSNLGSSPGHEGGKGPADVEPGRSPLEPYGDEVLVEAGEQLVIAQASEGGVKTKHSAPKEHKSAGTEVVQAATAWTQQRLIFNSSPLTEVAEEFNRYNRRALVIDDATLKSFHISGNFSSTDPTLLIRFLRDQPEIVVNETGNEIHVTRRSST